VSYDDVVVGSERERSRKLERVRFGSRIQAAKPLGRTWRAVASTVAVAGCLGWLAAAAAAQAGRTVWSGIYSEPQARRGEEAYKGQCAYCHQPDLSGGFFDNGTGRAPALAGPKAFDSSFVERWRDQTVGEFIATIAATMPQTKPASLPVQTYIDIAAFVMSKNGIPAGAADLPADIPTLQEIAIVPKP
jgi:cytochrome c